MKWYIIIVPAAFKRYKENTRVIFTLRNPTTQKKWTNSSKTTNHHSSNEMKQNSPVTFKEIELVLKILWEKISRWFHWTILSNGLRKTSTNFIQSLPETRKGRNTSLLTLQGQYQSDTKTRQRSYNKENQRLISLINLGTNITNKISVNQIQQCIKKYINMTKQNLFQAGWFNMHGQLNINGKP